MEETIGISWGGVRSGFMVALLGNIALATVVWCILLFRSQSYSKKVLRPVLFGAMIGFILGGAISESLIAQDENSFYTEAATAAANGEESFNRPRAWPNRTGALLWSRDRGWWATD